MSTVISPSGSARTSRVPPRVATANSGPPTRSWSSRYRPNTLMPFPHISARVPSAFR